MGGRQRTTLFMGIGEKSGSTSEEESKKGRKGKEKKRKK